jgi:8-oxo-dGTP diphosphatase
VPRSVHQLLLGIYRHLPMWLRRGIAGWTAPTFIVGTICLVTRDDGRLLLVRHSYRDQWGFPGGLLARGESAEACARREGWEEVGVRLTPMGEPTVVIVPRGRRVDVVFRCRLDDGVDPDEAAPRSPEIVEARWFHRDALPELQVEAAGGLAALEAREAGVARPG